MRLLLDTHALVWALSDVPNLTENARTAIADPHSFCQRHYCLGDYSQAGEGTAHRPGQFVKRA